ncbi:phage tail protein [Enterobacter roggenkampii]|uniref:phage tail protein n=1 Tax=Enterobacter roggenkampii TaxID=1812935 RepID=UPI002FD7DC8A
MATNNFKPFATAANANVMSQADWEGLPALLSGFTSGKAASAEVNKAIRQASFIAAALAQYTANKSGLDVLDDGDVSGFIAKMTTALGKDFQGLDATLTALAGLTTGANKLPYFTGTDTAAQTDLTSVGRDIIGSNTIADILTYLGLNTALAAKQPLDATLTALAGLTTGANKLPYFTGTDTASQTDLTSVGRDIIGSNTIADILTYLRLGAGAPAIGIPFFWPSSAMPNTVMTEWADMVFLKFNGSTFSASNYPKLALVFPALTLPESRGEFLRIWDDGRGVDAGRGLLSAQGYAYESHSHRLLMSAGSAGSGRVIGIDSDLNGTLTYNINQPGGGQIQAIENAGGTETRPRNIAFNFLVRAK